MNVQVAWGGGAEDVGRMEKYSKVAQKEVSLLSMEAFKQKLPVGHAGEVSVVVRLPACTLPPCNSLETSALY